MRLVDFDYITDAEVGPDGTLAYISDASGRPQVWLQRPGGEPRLLAAPGSARRAAWHPAGRRLLVLLDPDGTEQHGLAELDAADGTLTWLVDSPAARCEIGPPYTTLAQPYSRDGRQVAYSSTARDPEVFDVVVRVDGAERIVLRGDDRYFAVAFSPDGSRLLVLRLHQNTEHDLFVVDLDRDEARQLTDGAVAKHVPVAWAPDGESIYLCTTQGRDFLGLARLHLDGRLDWIDVPDCDVVGAALAPDGATLAWARDRHGYSELCWARPGEPTRVVAGLPAGLLAEEVAFGGHRLTFAPDGRVIALLGRAETATEVVAIDLPSDRIETLTAAGARLPAGLVAPNVVRATAADGLETTALLFRPAGADAGHPAPVVMTVHGGPEARALPTYDPLTQALLARGIGVIAPNFRGSSGYGLRFQRLIYRDWGGGDVLDYAAVAALLREIDWVDVDRLGVHGASYGGFATQCCLTQLPDLWRAGVSECGPSDQLDDIATLPPTWRRRIIGWIGDPDDPADRARMQAHSPLRHAENVRAPLLILHGENDTRVDPRASERMYARLRELGKPVRLELHPGVGHEISRAGLAETTALIVDWFAENLL